MSDDREIARRSLDAQKRAKDVRYLDLPGYREWSQRKLAEGGNEAVIARIDSMSIWLRPEQVDEIDESVFEEVFEEIVAELD